MFSDLAKRTCVIALLLSSATLPACIAGRTTETTVDGRAAVELSFEEEEQFAREFGIEEDDR